MTQRDALGRTTRYLEYLRGGLGYVTHDRYNIVYDAAGQVTSESVSQVRKEIGAANTYLTHTVNSYAAGGLLAWSTADTWKNGNDAALADTRDDYSYAWREQANLTTHSHDSDTGSGSNPIWTTGYAYDGAGRLAKVHIADGRPRTVSFAATAEGQVILRKERSAASSRRGILIAFAT